MTIIAIIAIVIGLLILGYYVYEWLKMRNVNKGTW